MAETETDESTSADVDTNTDEAKPYENINVDWYNKLWTDRNRVTDLYFIKLKECESNRVKELNASICIQKYFRMFQLRTRFHLLNHSATQIQRIYKGYQARNYVEFEVKVQHKLQQQKLLYDRMATLIQKTFRGYISRKDKSDFYARKRYIQQLTIKSNELLQELRDQYDRNIETQKRMEELKKAEKFDQLIGNLHHLVSTKQIRGVFKSPFGREFSATAYGISVEQHIKQKFHHQFESQYYSNPQKYRTISTQKPRCT
eukprot:184047_1